MNAVGVPFLHSISTQFITPFFLSPSKVINQENDTLTWYSIFSFNNVSELYSVTKSACVGPFAYLSPYISL